MIKLKTMQKSIRSPSVQDSSSTLKQVKNPRRSVWSVKLMKKSNGSAKFKQRTGASTKRKSSWKSTNTSDSKCKTFTMLTYERSGLTGETSLAPLQAARKRVSNFHLTRHMAENNTWGTITHVGIARQASTKQGDVTDADKGKGQNISKLPRLTATNLHKLYSPSRLTHPKRHLSLSNKHLARKAIPAQRENSRNTPTTAHNQAAIMDATTQDAEHAISLSHIMPQLQRSARQENSCLTRTKLTLINKRPSKETRVNAAKYKDI